MKAITAVGGISGQIRRTEPAETWGPDSQWFAILPRVGGALPGLAEGCGTASGSGSSNSSTPQPRTAQMTSSSPSLTVFGWPDHGPDIFPALITRPRSASSRCSSLAFQMPQCSRL